METAIDILIPTYNRFSSLAVTLASLYFQQYTNFTIIIADQSETVHVHEDSLIQSITQMLKTKKISVYFYKNLPNRGIAQQRQFLLETAKNPFCLYLDDDIILEPWVIKNLYATILEQKCGFIGASVNQPNPSEKQFIQDEQIEFWNEKVLPEKIFPHSKKWQRHEIHKSSNFFSVVKKYHLSWKSPKIYKVAWVSGCVLYNRLNLLDVGGFSFWRSLPKEHFGEDVLAQIRVIEKYGGCGLIPSGVYHQNLQTTIPNRFVNASEFFLNYEV